MSAVKENSGSGMDGILEQIDQELETGKKLAEMRYQKPQELKHKWINDQKDKIEKHKKIKVKAHLSVSILTILYCPFN